MEARVRADRTSGQLSTEIAGSPAVTMHARARFEVSWHDDRLDGSGRQSTDLHWHQHHLSIRQMQASLQDQRRPTQSSREHTGAHENESASETGTVGIFVVSPSFWTLPDNRQPRLDPRLFAGGSRDRATERASPEWRQGLRRRRRRARGPSPHNFACFRVGTFAVRPAVRRRPA